MNKVVFGVSNGSRGQLGAVQLFQIAGHLQALTRVRSGFVDRLCAVSHACSRVEGRIQ